MRSMIYLCVAVLLIVGSSISTHAEVEDDGLILYFSFDKEKGGKIIDESGGGHDGETKDVEIITKDVVHGAGALACEEGTSSVTVDSFKELEDYTDNSYLFWLQFTVKNSGSWDQIIAKRHPVLIVPPVYGRVTEFRCTSTTGSIPGTREAIVSVQMERVMSLKPVIGITLLESKMVLN